MTCELLVHLQSAFAVLALIAFFMQYGTVHLCKALSCILTSAMSALSQQLGEATMHSAALHSCIKGIQLLVKLIR